MALKPDRLELETDLTYFMNETGERGIVVVYGSAAGGSGAAMDTSLAEVQIPTAGVSGTKPAGVLLNDVVNINQTRQHINFHQDEVQLGGKVLLLRRGWVVTNRVSGTPTLGADAYYNVNGFFTPTKTNDNTSEDNLKVGRFLGVADADSYVKVHVDIR